MPTGNDHNSWSSILFLFVALIWASFAILDVVTVGEGKVIPSSKLQIVQNLEGGIIKEIKVKEDQLSNSLGSTCFIEPKKVVRIFF